MTGSSEQNARGTINSKLDKDNTNDAVMAE